LEAGTLHNNNETYPLPHDHRNGFYDPYLNAQFQLKWAYT